MWLKGHALEHMLLQSQCPLNACLCNGSLIIVAQSELNTMF